MEICTSRGSLFDAERLKYPDQVVYAALQLTRGEILFHMITPLIWTVLSGFVVWKSMMRSKQ